jgi:hypothetical protein
MPIVVKRFAMSDDCGAIKKWSPSAFSAAASTPV